MDILFDPMTVGSLSIKNRIAMAPMTRNFCPDYVPGEEVVAYYRRRAEGEIGLLISEGTVIDHPAANGYPDVPHFYGTESLAGWKRVVDAVHKAGGKMFPQLWHVGSVRQREKHPCSGADNPSHCAQCRHPETPGYGPSSISHPYIENGEPPHEMSRTDIREIVESFARAAKNAKQIGFDGVELHGAHGYLIDQFFWDRTNHRADEYGGQTLAERTQFAQEVIRAVREAVGADFPIDLRISQWKLGDYTAKLTQTPQELEAFLTPLVEAGVDLFHCSTRRFWEPEFSGSTLNLAGWVQKITGKPTISVGSVGLQIDFIQTLKEGKQCSSAFGKLDELIQRMERNEFSLIAIGRALLADPSWLTKIRDGQSGQIVPFANELLKTLH